MKTYLLLFIISLLSFISISTGQEKVETLPVFFSDGWFSIWPKEKEDIVNELQKLNTTTGETQHLITIPELEYKQPQILFITDIDGDGKPDFILEEGYNYELFEIVLYLSSMAEEGELVKRAGADGTWHDC